MPKILKSSAVVFATCRRQSAVRAKLFALAAFTALSFCALQAASAPAQAQEALKLKQYSLLLGATELTLDKRGIRLAVPRRNLAMILTPPDWGVTFYNSQNKTFYQCKAADWRPQMASATAFFRPGDPSALMSVGSAAAEMQGIKCRKHTLKLPAVQNSAGTHTWEQLLVKSGELYVIDDPAFPKTPKNLIAKTFGTLQNAGFPLDLSCTNNRHEISHELRLESSSKVTLKPADLAVPKDFKRVKTANEVTSAKVDNEGFSDFIR